MTTRLGQPQSPGMYSGLENSADWGTLWLSPQQCLGPPRGVLTWQGHHHVSLRAGHRTKDHPLEDALSRKHLEYLQGNPRRQEADWRLPGAGSGQGERDCVLLGSGFPFGVKTV